MLRAMHLIVNAVTEAFEPEGGAYASGGHAHGGHSHGQDHHDHQHAQAAPSPAKKLSAIPIASAAAPHVHGPGCKHDH
jgi:urease accessory protein